MRKQNNMTMEDVTRINNTNEGLVLRSVPSGTEHILHGEMLVGREAECAIILPSNHASRYHAKINVSTHGVYIEDLHSTNGTYINGKRSVGRIRLTIGDEVTFDDLVFRFASMRSGTEDATVLSPKRSITQLQSIKPSTQKPQKVHVESFESIANRKKPQVSHLEEPVYDNWLEEESINDNWMQEEIKTQEIELDDENQTRMISSTHMDKLIERNKNDIRVDIGSGPRLIIMTAPLRGKLYQFDEALEGSRWQIGRSEDSNIQLNDKTISAEHALLIKTPQGFTLNAISAKNGIIINGIKQKQVLLKHNDKIQIGRTELLFRTDEPLHEHNQKPQKPYVELKNHRFTALSTITVVAVLLIAYFLTAK